MNQLNLQTAGPYRTSVCVYVCRNVISAVMTERRCVCLCVCVLSGALVGSHHSSPGDLS